MSGTLWLHAYSFLSSESGHFSRRFSFLFPPLFSFFRLHHKQFSWMNDATREEERSVSRTLLRDRYEWRWRTQRANCWRKSRLHTSYFTYICMHFLMEIQPPKYRTRYRARQNVEPRARTSRSAEAQIMGREREGTTGPSELFRENNYRSE